MNKFTPQLTIAVFFLLFFKSAFAVNPNLDWQTIHTKHFSIHYDKQHVMLAQHVAKISEFAHKRLSAELNWTPAEKTHLVLSDETDFANGFATVLNFNRSVLFFAPPTDINSLEDYDDWLKLLITHEYTHILHLDKVNGDPSKVRKFFGRFLLTFPNIFEPTWLIEGLATFKETDHERGIGRGQSALFKNMMRMEVLSGVKPIEQVNLPIRTWPGGTTQYLYGVYFYEFIKQRYGEEKINEFIEQYSDNLIPFLLNTTFETVYKKDASQMWGEYSLWLEEIFLPKAKQVEEQGIVSGERITNSAYRTGGVRVVNDATYYIENNGSQQAALVKETAGQKTVLTEVHQAGFDVHKSGNIVLSQVDVCEEFQFYNDLYIFQQKTNDLKRITYCGRYVKAIWHPNGESLYALKHEAANYSLLSLDLNGQVNEQLIQFEKNTAVGWFDVSSDAKEMVFSLWKPEHGWDLYKYDLSSKQWHVLTQDSYIQAYPEYSPDNQSVYYSADYNASYDLYRYDKDTHKHYQITNTLGGAFQSSISSESLSYIGYSADGTDVYTLNAFESINEYIPIAGRKNNILQYSDVDMQTEKYTPWSSLKPRYWFPLLSITEDITELGFTTTGNDALAIHNYFAAPVYDFKNKLPSLQLAYGYSNKFNVSIGRENDLFKNNLGFLNRIRTLDSLRFVYSLPNTQALSSSLFLFSLEFKKSFDQKLFAGAVPIVDISENQLGFAWLYNGARRYPLSISLNDGREIKLVVEDSELLNSDFNGQVYSFSWKEYFRLGGEHVLALSLFQGWGDGITSRFQLGGENTGVGYSILLEESGVGIFGRRDYALRGYEDGLPQLRGQRAQLASIEWRFPGERIERGIMVPPIAVMQWSGTIFAETGAAYNANKPSQYFSSAGVELVADLNVAYLVPLKARFGIAHGFNDVIGDTKLYLSLGSSF